MYRLTSRPWDKSNLQTCLPRPYWTRPWWVSAFLFSVLAHGDNSTRGASPDPWKKDASEVDAPYPTRVNARGQYLRSERRNTDAGCCVCFFTAHVAKHDRNTLCKYSIWSGASRIRAFWAEPGGVGKFYCCSISAIIELLPAKIWLRSSSHCWYL